MNILIINIPDINSPFYDLKYYLVEYFLSIAGGEKAQIIKFYGANVNPEILKRSLNTLFLMLLKSRNLTQILLKNPQSVNNILEGNRIYMILKKMY